MAGVSTPRRCGLLAMVGPRFLLLLLHLLAGLEGGSVVVRAQQSDREWEEERLSCSKTVESWSQAQLRELSSLPLESALDRVKLRDLLFFIHIPRTGGRTFHQCFLKHLFPSDERCPRSYDQLRIDRSQPGCRLISTHDDYSLLDKLPFDMRSVVTSIREPVGRVLSTYEFSIEVAARSLRRPLKRVPTKVPHIMNTVDIWPWKYLVPTMENDLFARRDARRSLGVPNGTGVPMYDSYDAPLMAMPFLEFIDHPVAYELVHNGATFQLAGLTNTSFAKNARAIRHCVIRFPPLGKLVVEVAKKRLDRMLYVGLTERQNESVLFIVKALRDEISMEVLMRSILNQPRSVRSNSLATPHSPKLQSNFTSLDEFTEEEVIAEMLESYGGCVAELRRAQEGRRSISLETIKPIKFSRERRKVIPDSVMSRVFVLNSLDAELFAYAKVLFQQQQKFLKFKFLEDPKLPSGDSDVAQEGVKANFKEGVKANFKEGVKANSKLTLYLKYVTDIAKWVTALWVLIVLVILSTVLYLVRNRRGARVKEI